MGKCLMARSVRGGRCGRRSGRRGLPVRRRGVLFEQHARLRLVLGEIFERGVEVGALAFEDLAMAHHRVEKSLKLRERVGRRLVEIEQRADFVEREAEALAAQGQLQARAVASGKHTLEPARAFAAGRQQALVLVETDRARRHVEFAGEFGNRVMGHDWWAPLAAGRVRRQGGVFVVRIDVYVIVNLQVSQPCRDGENRSRAARDRLAPGRSVDIVPRTGTLSRILCTNTAMRRQCGTDGARPTPHRADSHT
ncbi:hypothetical protein PT2222_40335 [Paraburkholderia tropica]